MHPLSRPVRFIIGLCVVIIGLNVFVLWWLQTLTSTFPFASRQADRSLPSLAVAPCEPTVAGNEVEIAERDTMIARLEAEVERMKRAHDDDRSAWRAKSVQLEKDLMVLQKAAERVMEMDAQNWQEGRLMLAQAMVKKKI